MKIKREIQHIGFLYNQGGIAKLLNHVRENILFDIKHATNTSAWLEKDGFEAHPDNFEHGVRYRAAATSEIEYGLRIASNHIDIEHAGFYDLGCGKGKVLCIAGLKYGFASISGIDYYQPFLDQARQNLIACNLDHIPLHYQDMSQFKDYSKTSVIFLYNPAGNSVLEGVRRNIEETTDKAIVIYNKPVHTDIFKGWNTLSKRNAPDPDHTTHIYGFGV
ncbi:MAG: class I SAM-dependent methyltransferase [Alphaproteobacteria bacterium]